MAPRANVFISDFKAFRESISDLAHYQFMVRWRLKEANESAKRSIAELKRRGYKSEFLGANRVTITDVFHNGSGPRRAPGIARVTKGTKIVPMTKEMGSRLHSYLIVAAYERFESLLKSYYAILLYQLRGHVTLPAKSRFHGEQPKMVKKDGTPPYYRAYVKHACRRKCDEAVTALTKKLPLETMTYDWDHDLSFQEFIKCLSFCRNSIVHSEGRWPVDTKIPLDKEQQVFVRSHMRKSILTGEPTILPDDRQTDHIMEMLVSYAYGLYVLLSEKFDMKMENAYFKR